MKTNKYEVSLNVAILSDSHTKTKLTQDAVDMLKSKGAEYLIHAGDLETKEHLDILHNSKLPYITIFGNNDYNLVQYQDLYNIYKEPYYFKIKDLRFKLMHLPFYMNNDTNIIISGHTHIFEHQYTNNTLYLNPGEICAREKNLTECVLLKITKTEYIIEYNYKKPNEKQWETKKYVYTR